MMSETFEKFFRWLSFRNSWWFWSMTWHRWNKLSTIFLSMISSKFSIWLWKYRTTSLMTSVPTFTEYFVDSWHFLSCLSNQKISSSLKKRTKFLIKWNWKQFLFCKPIRFRSVKNVNKLQPINDRYLKYKQISTNQQSREERNVNKLQKKPTYIWSFERWHWTERSFRSVDEGVTKEIWCGPMRIELSHSLQRYHGRSNRLFWRNLR